MPAGSAGRCVVVLLRFRFRCRFGEVRKLVWIAKEHFRHIEGASFGQCTQIKNGRPDPLTAILAGDEGKSHRLPLAGLGRNHRGGIGAQLGPRFEILHDRDGKLQFLRAHQPEAEFISLSGDDFSAGREYHLDVLRLSTWNIRR